MTGSELVAFLNKLIGENLSDEDGLELINTAKDEIEGERDWAILRAEDLSKSTTSSTVYTTEFDLPTGFLVARNVIINESPYYEFPFDQRHINKNIGGHFYIDYANNHLYIAEQFSAAYTIYLYYTKKTDDITAASTWSFPKNHKVLAYRAAEIYLAGINADEITRQQVPEHVKTYENLMNGLIYWDAKLQRSMMNGQTPIKGDIPSTKDRIIGFRE